MTILERVKNWLATRVKRGPAVPVKPEEGGIAVKRGPFVPSFVAEITAKSRQQKIIENRQMFKNGPFRQELPIKRGLVAYTPESKSRVLRKAGIGVA